MSRFQIQFDPDLPDVPHSNVAIAPEKVDWRKVIAALPQEFDTRYVIGEALVAYYPTAIANVFADIYGEWRMFRAREPHVMCWCGYPVLDVSFAGKKTLFFHSHELSLGDAREPIAGDYNAADVEVAFKAALDRVWSVINSAS